MDASHEASTIPRPKEMGFRQQIGEWVDVRVLNPYAVRSWNEDRRVNHSFVVLAEHRSITDLLTGRANKLRPESGFFRIGSSSLNDSQVSEGSKSARRILLETRSSRQGTAGDVLARHLGSPSGFFTRGFGHLLVADYFSTFIALDRPPEVTDLVNRYILESLIPDDVRRRSLRRYAALPRLRRALTGLLEHADHRNPSQDLVDVALAAAKDKEDAAELFQRLVLATAGFTGAALEWLFVHSAWHHGLYSPRDFVLESLRMSSVACRLTRVAEYPTHTAGISILPGDQILLNIYAANRDEAAWSSPTDFLPERWSTEIGERRNISFGKGKRVCPAQNAAIEALIDFRQVIEANYGVRFFKLPLSRSRVGTLIAPPNGYVSVRPKKTLRD